VSRVFFGSLAAGIALALAVALFYPAAAPPRLPSLISVQPDGGRREEFLVRWPEDRIALPADLRAARAGAAAATDSAGTLVLADSAGRRVSGEVFRLRDAGGNVVGVASRVTAGGGARPVADWMLVIPGRGALLLHQADATDLAARALPGPPRRAASPAQQVGFWSGRREFRATAPGGGTVVHGTREFAGLTGSFTETWAVDGKAADGATRGSIRLVTLLRQPP
jgi:hypothetical protein